MIPNRNKGRFSLGRAAQVYQTGLAAFESGRLSEAIALLTQIKDDNCLPGTLARFYLGQAHFRRGIEELRAKRYTAAAGDLMAARELNPDSADLSRYLAA